MNEPSMEIDKAGMKIAIRSAFSKFMDFNGTANRPEFQNYLIFLIGFQIVVCILNYILMAISPSLSAITSIIWFIALVVWVPAIALTLRRLRTVGLSPWLTLLLIVPVLGPIILIIMGASDKRPVV